MVNTSRDMRLKSVINRPSHFLKDSTLCPQSRMSIILLQFPCKFALQGDFGMFLQVDIHTSLHQCHQCHPFHSHDHNPQPIIHCGRLPQGLLLSSTSFHVSAIVLHHWHLRLQVPSPNHLPLHRTPLSPPSQRRTTRRFLTMISQWIPAPGKLPAISAISSSKTSTTKSSSLNMISKNSFPSTEQSLPPSSRLIRRNPRPHKLFPRDLDLLPFRGRRKHNLQGIRCKVQLWGGRRSL